MKTYLGLIVAAAVGMVALTATAQEEVHSVNIVGYQKVDITGGNFHLMSVNWDSSGTNDSIDIQDLLDTSALQGGDGPGAGDNIYIWNSSLGEYESYWLADSEGVYPELDGKWLDDNYSPVERSMPRGTAFWLYTRIAGSTNFNIVGQVPLISTDSKWIYNNTFNLIASSFAADMPINGTFDWLAAGAKGGDGPGSGDNLYVWNGIAYESYWLADSEGVYPEVDGKWLDDNYNPADASIKLGSAAWYYSRASTDWLWNEPRPYLND